jgi:transcriptional regulator with XRE-family HTH domain
MAILKDLVQLRKQQKVTQKEMAKRIGMTPERLSRYERGNRKINIDFVVDYALAIGYELRLLKK